MRKLLKYNIHLGFSAAISGLSNYYLFNQFSFHFISALTICGIQLCSVVAAYNYFRKRNKLSWQIPLLICFLLCFLIGWKLRILIFLTGIIASLYHISGKIKIGFRYQPFLKSFIIGLCWAVITILISAASSLKLNLEWSILKDEKTMQLILMIFILRIFEMVSLCILTDLLHVNTDKINGLQTIPNLFGTKKTFWISRLMAAFQLIYAVIMMSISTENFWLEGKFVIGFLLILLSIFLIAKRRNPYHMEILLDTVILIEGTIGTALLYFHLH